MKSRLRITGGRFRGHVLPQLVHEGVRPTTERVRRSFFDRIGSDMQSVHFVDGYAGSGIMGMEALSRGAGKTVFLESDRLACDRIKHNLEHLKSGSCASVISGDIEKNIAGVLETLTMKTVFYFDPPYNVMTLKPLFDQMASVSSNRNIVFIAVEHHHKNSLTEGLQGWKVSAQYRFGETAVTYVIPNKRENEVIQ